MILGLGIDIVEIERIRRAVERFGERFLHRALTDEEWSAFVNYAHPFPHYAGRFAAKEAVMKALGTGWGGGVGWQQIVVTNRPSGEPQVELRGAAAERLKQLGGKRVLVSISHSQHYAVAVAIVEG
ncbi:MAG TPA: holo-ACP synthase [Armatimonadetes bacterium]|nr:holo-ACP synthase [Armatimonadota bacterium]